MAQDYVFEAEIRLTVVPRKRSLLYIYYCIIVEFDNCFSWYGASLHPFSLLALKYYYVLQYYAT